MRHYECVVPHTWGLHLLTDILAREFILWVLKLSKIKPIYCRYWGVGGLGWRRGGLGGFIRIGV